MNTFHFNSVPNVISGSGKINELSSICVKHKILKPLVVTDFGIIKQGYVKIIGKILSKNKIEISIFDEVKADPPEKNIFDAVYIAKKNKCDSIIGLGGGSLLWSRKINT